MRKLIISVVLAAVVVICIGSVLAPIVNDAREGYDETFTNTGSGNVLVSPITADMTIAYDGTTMTYNGVAASTITSRCCVTFDNGFLYHGSDPTYGKLYVVEGTTYSAVIMSEYTAVFDADDGTVSITGTDTDSNAVSISTTFEWAYIPDSSGKYISVDSNFSRDFKINSVDDLRSIQYVSSGILLTSDGDELKVNGEVQGTLNAELTAVSGYTDLYTIHVENTAADSGLTYTYNSTDYAPHWTILPLSVTAHLTENDGIVNLYGAIVPIVVISLVLAVVAMFVRSKMY